MDAEDLPVASIRDASRRLVRELGFLRGTLAGTDLPPSAVHALVEIGAQPSLSAADLAERLILEKSSVSRMLRKLVEAGEVAETPSARDGRAKHLMLTPQGCRTLGAIDAYAGDQVRAAMEALTPEARRTVQAGLGQYAGALAATRHHPAPRPAPDRVTIEPGYRPGLIGRAVELHAVTYARLAGFGRRFESTVAAGLAGFCDRLDHAGNEVWVALRDGAILGTVVIDGQDMGPDSAHLRWFIVDEALRGAGIGRRLLTHALDFCDAAGFAQTQLWTFRGLDGARALYEAHGFGLAEERPGRQWGEEVLEQRFVRPACVGDDSAGADQVAAACEEGAQGLCP